MHPGSVSPADAALLREFVEHVPAAVAMFDRQMRYILVSRRWMEDYRLGKQEIIGRTHYEVFPEITERWKELHRRALAGEVVRCDEDRFERADGTVDWVRWEIRPWYTISGKVGGVTMFTEVITERKHVEDAIRASETRFRILSTSAPIGIFELDAEGRCQYVNTRWEAITGRTSEEGLGYGWHQTIHPEDREWLLQEARERIRAGFPGEREFRILRPDGSVRWVRVHVAPMVDPQAGRPSGFVGTLDDITAEKEAEEKLQASEQRFMALVNSNIVGIVLGDMSGRIYKANDAFLKMAGYTRADLAAGKVRWSLLTSPESAPEDQRALAELQEKGTAGPWEKEYTRKDGSRVPVLIGLARLGATGSQTIGFVLDLSERKRAEGALRLIAQASRVLASSPDFPDAVNRIAHLLVPTLGDWCVIHVLDEEGNVQRAAVAAADPAQASLARQWMEAPPPAPEAIQPLLQALRTGKTQLLKGVSDELWPAMINSEARVAVMRQVGATSMLVVPFIVRGHLTGWASFLTTRPGRTYQPPDITLAEEVAHHVAQALDNARLYQEAREANAAKDQFLAVLSHELRNPLSPILTGVEVLRRSIPLDPRTERVLTLIERNAELQARLITDLLDFSRIRRGAIGIERSPVPLDAAVNAAVESTQGEAKAAGLAVKLEIQPGVWVLGDLDRLQQIVVNLLTNAIKFTPPGGEVRVRVERGEHVGRVIVEDTGVGIDAALMPRLFEMFQQGEIEGQRARGLGIGLALVKHLTELHGGRVWAESEGVGKGSRFTVELPLAPAAAREPAEKEAREPMAVRILLVEDNADARELLQAGLELLGYTVEAVGSGEEALALLSEMRPDVIVADIGLPGVDGYEFLRQARRIPGLANVPAFAATGYGRPEDVARAHEAGFTDHFVKPVDIADLDARIRSYLETKRHG